jgi:spoIIIJ-associated protein
MGIEGSVTAEFREEISHVDIESSGMDGLLIGRNGTTLQALQHIVSRMAYRRNPNHRVVIDVGGYRARRMSFLRKKALSLAERVKAGGQEMMMEPLQSAERRIVHIALNADPDVRTYTVGEGVLRSVVVAPTAEDVSTDEASRSGPHPEIPGHAGAPDNRSLGVGNEGGESRAG